MNYGSANFPLDLPTLSGLGSSTLDATQQRAIAELKRGISDAEKGIFLRWDTLTLLVDTWYNYYASSSTYDRQLRYNTYAQKTLHAVTDDAKHRALIAQAKSLIKFIAAGFRHKPTEAPPPPFVFKVDSLPTWGTPIQGGTVSPTMGPDTGRMPQPGMFGLGAMGIGVDIKIPKAVTEAARLAPSIAKEFPAYAHKLQEEAARVTGTVDAVNIGIQAIAVAGIFGGIVLVLLMREKGK